MSGTNGPLTKGRDETPEERSDRNWNELLQEMRVMQTGTQILTGFLLTLPFQSRFTELDRFQVGVYLALVVLSTMTTITVVAPVSLHRILFGKRLKPETVDSGNRLVKVGLGLLGVVVVGVVLLVFDVVTTRTVALTVAGALGLLTVAAWLVLPHGVRHRDA